MKIKYGYDSILEIDYIGVINYEYYGRIGRVGVYGKYHKVETILIRRIL